MNAPTTKRREIYACVAVQLRTHDRATKAESLCPGAMGMYLYLLLQARGEETAGDVLEANALASWGAPMAYRRKQLAALIDSGLVASIAGGRVLVVKYEEHNDGPGAIAANREAAKERKQRSRHGHVTRDSSVTLGVTAPFGHTQVPSSCSSSISFSDLESRSRDPDSSPREALEDRPSRPHNDAPPCAAPTSLVTVPDAMAAPPDWWDAVIATLHASTGVLVPAGPCWLSYAGHRASKGRPAERGDALYWLNQVKVPEERERLRREARDRERDAKFDASRARPPGHIEPLTVTPAQAEHDAKALVARIAARKAKGAA